MTAVGWKTLEHQPRRVESRRRSYRRPKMFLILCRRLQRRLSCAMSLPRGSRPGILPLSFLSCTASLDQLKSSPRSDRSHPAGGRMPRRERNGLTCCEPAQPANVVPKLPFFPRTGSSPSRAQSAAGDQAICRPVSDNGRKTPNQLCPTRTPKDLRPFPIKARNHVPGRQALPARQLPVLMRATFSTPLAGNP